MPDRNYQMVNPDNAVAFTQKIAELIASAETTTGMWPELDHHFHDITRSLRKAYRQAVTLSQNAIELRREQEDIRDNGSKARRKRGKKS